MTIRAVAAIIVLVVAPLIPLGVTWRRFIRDVNMGEQGPTIQLWLETILASLSFALLLVGLIWNPILGADYSTRRMATIYANFVIMVVVGVAAALGARRYKLPLAASGLLVALEWAYLAVVGSVV